MFDPPYPLPSPKATLPSSSFPSLPLPCPLPSQLLSTLLSVVSGASLALAFEVPRREKLLKTRSSRGTDRIY